MWGVGGMSLTNASHKAVLDVLIPHILISFFSLVLTSCSSSNQKTTTVVLLGLRVGPVTAISRWNCLGIGLATSLSSLAVLCLMIQVYVSSCQRATGESQNVNNTESSQDGTLGLGLSLGPS